MRQAGHLDNELHARLFGDFLFNRGIEAEVESNADGSWSVWVVDDDRIEEAEALLVSFREHPDAPEYTEGATGAEEKRAAAEKADAAFARNYRSRDDLFKTYGYSGIGMVTLAFMVLSVFVTLLCRFDGNTDLIRKLSIAEVVQLPNQAAFYRTGLAEVREGQVWRLFTPIFMHFSFLHILFNMLWLRDLGSMLERRRGPWFMLGFLLVVAAISNTAQFYVSGPSFGGMSGVVYALLGYVWMQTRFNPWSGMTLHPTTVQMMLIWFVLCLTGLMGPIANTVHGVGLVIGVAWGYLDARRRVPE